MLKGLIDNEEYEDIKEKYEDGEPVKGPDGKPKISIKDIKAGLGGLSAKAANIIETQKTEVKLKN